MKKFRPKLVCGNCKEEVSWSWVCCPCCGFVIDHFKLKDENN